MDLRNQAIGHNIMVIDKYMRLYLKDLLRPHQLNTAEGLVLLVLYGRDGTTQEEIFSDLHQGTVGATQDQMIDALHYDKGVMTRTMQALEGKGFVERQPNALDGRSYLFYLTPSAIAYKPVLLSILRQWSEAILQGLDERVVQTLHEALCQMAENAKTITGRNTKK